MSALSSRSYSHRSRNGFLAALWLVENDEAAFSAVPANERKILLAMLRSQCKQKLKQPFKKMNYFTANQAQLMWRIRDCRTDPSELMSTLIRHTVEFGLPLVEAGLISILPDDHLKDWELVLSPEGKDYAASLASARHEDL